MRDEWESVAQLHQHGVIDDEFPAAAPRTAQRLASADGGRRQTLPPTPVRFDSVYTSRPLTGEAFVDRTSLEPLGEGATWLVLMSAALFGLVALASWARSINTVHEYFVATGLCAIALAAATAFATIRLSRAIRTRRH
ncbi:MAG: hypothetical protein M3N57_10540 [Actinomycetota bacterium]|nr:hypothetical protein [Actinomycetota bacterium]